MNEVGAKFGGPIIKNKLFMFYNYGQYRFQHGPANQLQTIPTTAMLERRLLGVFYRPPATTSTIPARQTVRGCLGSTASPCHPHPVRFYRWRCNRPGQSTSFPTTRISAAAKYINKYMAPYEASALQTPILQQHRRRLSIRPVELVPGRPHRLRHEPEEPGQPRSSNSAARPAPDPTLPAQLNALGPPFNTSQAYTPKTTVDIVKDTYTINSHMVNLFVGCLCPLQEPFGHAGRSSAVRCQQDGAFEHARRPGQLLPRHRLQRRRRQPRERSRLRREPEGQQLLQRSLTISSGSSASTTSPSAARSSRTSSTTSRT